MYDPALARFHTIDPLASMYSGQSPYVYAANNPIRYIDYKGMQASEVAKREENDDDEEKKVDPRDNSTTTDYSSSVTIYTGKGRITLSSGSKVTRTEKYGVDEKANAFVHINYSVEDVSSFEISDDASSQGGLPSKVDLQDKPVTQLISWYRAINQNNGINPNTGNSFHVSDIIDPNTIPKKPFLKQAFGSMTNDAIEGTTYFGSDIVKWYIVDSYYQKNWNSNYISYIMPDNPSSTNMFRLRAMFNNECRISIVFYNESLFKHFYNEVYK